MPLNLDLLFRENSYAPKVVGKGVDPTALMQMRMQQQQNDSQNALELQKLQALLSNANADRALDMEKAQLTSGASQLDSMLKNQLERDKFDFDKSIKGPESDMKLALDAQTFAKNDREENDVASMRKAAQEGEASYIQALQQMDPNKALDYLDKKQKLRGTILDNNMKLVDMDDKQLQTTIKRSSAIGNLGFTLEGIQDPTQRALAYQQMLPELRKIDPNAPTEYNQNYTVAGIVQSLGIQDQIKTNPYLGARAQIGPARKQYEQQIADQQAQDLQKSTYASTPDIIKIQKYRDELISQRDELKSQGQSTIALDNKINELNQSSSVGGLSQQDMITGSSKLRQNYLDNTKFFREIGQAYGKINTVAQNISPAGDIALIFNYMKMLDPSSVVREGEFATAQNSGSVPTRIQASYNKLLKGERLTPEQRNDFLTQAYNLYQAQEQDYNKIVEQYTGIANRNKLNPSDVVVDFRVPGREQAPKLKSNINNKNPVIQFKGKNYQRGANGKWLAV